jgi:hypothetical protein
MNTTASATSKHKIVVTIAHAPAIDGYAKVQCYMLPDAAVDFPTVQLKKAEN